MKLASFNLYQFAAPPYFWYERKPRNTYTYKQWEQKTQWIQKQLETMDADVVGFQEVFSPDELRTLVETAGYPHFATLDTPATDDDDRVFVKPVVAIASRHSIKHIEEVKVRHQVCKDLPLEPGFKFSRPPIRAIIETEDFGEIQVYVAHLKSKRPMIDELIYPEDMPWDERVRDQMRRLSRGNIAALLQRGAEATLVYHDVMLQLEENPNLPIVVLGDLNDDEKSIPLAALTMQGRIYDIGGISAKDWPKGTAAAMYDYRLYDGFRMAPTMKDKIRPYTHIYRGHGGVLDYVLVSNALNPKNYDGIGAVSDFQVLNEHLDSDGVGDRLQSDHGQVLISLTARHKTEEEAEPTIPDAALVVPAEPTPSSEDNEGITRQDFIDLAGGVFQSRQQYKNWRGSDKWDNFWSFFFDTDRGWVKSVYGAIPVDELYQKRRHSIEHIIPKSFLKDYLGRQGVPNQVRYGATVNPFNFVPCERGLNSSRSNFPFDMDDDKVKRPFRIHLNPDAYATTGLDAENEWVIPSRTRGDIARAILYMVLVYGIDELYNEHVATLVHWAKVDSPTAWEIAYNQWVEAKHGIRNPFIDTPENALKLLDNKTLMNSSVLK